MSKFYYKGRIEIMGKYGKQGYNPKPNVKHGSKERPLSLVVGTQNRKDELEAVLSEHGLFAHIEINADKAENIVELDTVLSIPKTQVFAKTPLRNDPCSCGSGNKYKKCCG